MKTRHLLWVLGTLALVGCETNTAVRKTTTTTTTTTVAVARPVIAETPLTGSVVWPATAPTIYARSAIMIDARTGRTIYQKNADALTQVASTQKLLTALLIAESGNLSSLVTIAPSDTLVEPTKLGLGSGQKYSRYDLLGAMLVKSENDAAAALARDHSGSTFAFAREMNLKAYELGATHSAFVNPHGLPAAQYSNARDMARIAFHAYRNPTLRRFISTKNYPFTFNSGRTKVLENTNKLLGRVPEVNGMKTGYTNAAGRCLVTSATYGGREVILVQLGSKTTYIFSDAERMIRWGLGQASPSYFASN